LTDPLITQTDQLPLGACKTCRDRDVEIHDDAQVDLTGQRVGHCFFCARNLSGSEARMCRALLSAMTRASAWRGWL
jgi:hypothetical protein